jgi:flagellar basal-body rod modification protein FlgD
MSSITNPLTSHAAATAATVGATSPASSFLTLLVSQLQNQDPLSPTDSNQFVSQLTSYSQLEQLIGIHQNTTSLAGDASSTASGNTTTGSTTSTTGN